MKTTWNAEMVAEAIAKQLYFIAANPIPMAVVDYGLNWRKIGATVRFGVRDLRHVEIYNLKVVALNDAAK